MRSTLTKDALASVVVFLVALPLCMGIAIASGVPPALGLITGIVGGLIVGVLAGSPLQVSGPAAGLAVIVYDLIQRNGIEMLGPVVLLAGLFQLIAGLLRWGQYFRAVAPPVIYGMLAGIGVLIFASQFHVMVDDQPRGSGLENLVSIPEALYKGLVPMDASNHHLAALVGVSTIATILLWASFRPVQLKFVPPALAAVVVGSIVAAVGRLEVNYVDVPSNLLHAVTWPSGENLWRLADPSLLGAAAALALIASAETLLCAVAVDRMHDGPRTQFNRELLAQGVGNAICGMAGALPMTGVIVRSSANVEAGARTRLSAILHGAWLVALVVAFPAVLRLIPIAALAALLVYTGFKLVSVGQIRSLAAYGRMPLVIYFATLLGIVVTNLLTGVLIGVGLSVAHLIYSLAHLKIDLRIAADQKRTDLWLEGSATFLSLPRLGATLERVPEGVELHVHIERLQHIDHACLDALHDWQRQHAQCGSSMVVEWQDLVTRYGGPAPAPDKPVK
jgi:MFS superfamily sulfate permease-like transporter